MAGEKRTRKFEARKLQATIKKRRAHKAHSQKIKQRERKRESNRAEARDTLPVPAVPKSDDLGFDAFVGSGEFARELQEELARADGSSASEDEEVNEAISGDGDGTEGKSGAEGGADEDDEEDKEEEEEGVDALERHKAQLDALRKSDPEFVRHLEQEEPDLLNFGVDDEDEEEGEDAEEADDDGVERAEHGAEKAEALPSTAEEVQALAEEAVLSFPALKRLFRFFGTAAQAGRSTRPALASKAFDALLALCLTQAPQLFAAHLSTDLSAITFSSLHRLPHWARLQRVVKTFLGHVIHLITSLADAALLAFALAHTRHLSVFFAPFPRMALKYLKVLTHSWATADSAPSLAAFLAVRQLASSLDPPFGDTCVRHSYLTYVRHAAFPSPQRLPALQFMLNGLAELIRPAPARAYALGFVSLRELALLMRRALQTRAADATKQVHSWAYVHALRVWARIITEHAPSNAQLALLTYPLMQLVDGLLLLSSAPALLPLRLHAARLMVDISAGTGVYASPLAALFEVLDSPLIRRKARLASTAQTRPPDLNVILRAPPSVSQTRAYQEAVLHSTLHLLVDFFATHACSLAFPELAAASIAWLRKWLKAGVRTADAAAQSKQLIERLEAQRRWLLQRRAASPVAPADDAACGSFLSAESERNTAPLVKFAAQYSAKASSLALQRAEKRKDKHAAGKGSNSTAQDNGEDGDEEEEEAAGMKAKQQGKRNVVMPAAKRQRATPAHSTEADVVEELQLSDAE